MNPVPRRPSADDGAPPAANQSATRLKSTDDDVVVRPVSAKGLAARVRARFGTFTSWLSSGVKKDYNITKTGPPTQKNNMAGSPWSPPGRAQGVLRGGG